MICLIIEKKKTKTLEKKPNSEQIQKNNSWNRK